MESALRALVRVLLPRNVNPRRREIAVTVVLWVLIANVVLSVFFNLRFGNTFTIPFLNNVSYAVFENVAQILLIGWIAGRATLSAVREQEILHTKVYQTNLEMLSRLAQVAECRDDMSGYHNQRIGAMATVLAAVHGYSKHSIDEIYHAATLHDIGKIAIPDRILRKRGPLDAQERTEVQSHTIVGSNILENGDSTIELARKIARWHHESWDGHGYPDGLKGEQIPVIARIVAVCDVFDALLSDRPYKEAWAWEDAVDEIRRLSGSRFDPEVVQTFERSLCSLRRIWLDDQVLPDRDGEIPVKRIEALSRL